MFLKAAAGQLEKGDQNLSMSLLFWVYSFCISQKFVWLNSLGFELSFNLLRRKLL